MKNFLFALICFLSIFLSSIKQASARAEVEPERHRPPAIFSLFKDGDDAIIHVNRPGAKMIKSFLVVELDGLKLTSAIDEVKAKLIAKRPGKAKFKNLTLRLYDGCDNGCDRNFTKFIESMKIESKEAGSGIATGKRQLSFYIQGNGSADFSSINFFECLPVKVTEVIDDTIKGPVYLVDFTFQKIEMK